MGSLELIRICFIILLSSSISLQVTVFVDGMFALNQDIQAFREHVRDFLVQIKVGLFYQLWTKLFKTFSSVWLKSEVFLFKF